MKLKYSIPINIIKIFFFLLGIFASLFIFHEIYHLHNGIPNGVCIGNCQVEGIKDLIPMILFFDNLDINIKNEENSAWAFSIILNFIILFIYWILHKLRKEYNEKMS